MRGAAQRRQVWTLGLSLAAGCAEPAVSDLGEPGSSDAASTTQAPDRAAGSSSSVADETGQVPDRAPGSSSSAAEGTGAGESSASPPPPDDLPPPTTSFTEVTEAAGLFLDPGEVHMPPDCLLDFPGLGIPGDYCVPERYLGAVAVGDFDGDDWPDLYLTRIDHVGALMRNLGDGTFTDVTETAGLGDAPTVGGAAWLDIEGDGDLDLMLTSFGGLRHHLYVNDGAGHFDEQARRRGVALANRHVHVGTSIGVGDYDLDGYLDMFVGDWRSNAALGAGPDHNRLLHNLGAAAPGYFEDVTLEQGIDLQAVSELVGAPPGAFGFAPAFVDLDGDRWPELALAGDYGTSRLWWNDGAGRFVDGTEAAGVGTDRHGMGSAFGDFDEDGDLDWFVSAIRLADGTGGNRLYRNDGDRTFLDVSLELGVRDGGWAWGASFFDAELDGDLDLALAAGWPNLTFAEDPVRLWVNDEPGMAWPDRAVELGVDYTSSSRGLVALDHDRDGDLDLLAVGNTEPPGLWRNDVEGGSWLEVRAAGHAGNPQSIGAVVRVRTTATGPWQVRHIGVGSHLFGQAEAAAYFGLGAGDEPLDTVEVYWPDNDATIVLHDVARDQRLVVGDP